MIASLPPSVAAVWIDPFDDAGGLIVEGADLEDLRRYARWRLVVEGVLARGAVALLEADDLQIAAIGGRVATEPARDGVKLYVFGSPDGPAAFTERVPAGEPINFVHFPGRELPARIAIVRETNTVVGIVVDPAGPSILGPLQLPSGW